jgi:hypothetical protein
LACIIVAWNVHGDQQYEAGRDTANQAWKLKWAERDKSDALAQALWNDAKQEMKSAATDEEEKQPMVKAQQRIRLMPMMLSVLLTACSSSSLPSVSSSGSITPLSALGRQPQTPEFCLPTCSKNLSNETGNWQNTLTGQLKPERSVKDSTMN